MSKRNWKRTAPTSLRNAMELCVEFARERKNKSVEQIADDMGLASHWTLYKWIESARLPANMIRPFELATCATYVTQYLATSHHKLLVDIPATKRANDNDLLTLNSAFNDALKVLEGFYKGASTGEETLNELRNVMTGIAGHHARVESYATPELGLFESNDE